MRPAYGDSGNEDESPKPKCPGRGLPKMGAIQALASLDCLSKSQ
jgi:hypothetical protein